MFKDILIPLALGQIHEAAVRQACTLAAAHEGHVTALVAVSLAVPIAAAWAYYPVGVYENMDEAAKATTRELAEAVEQRFAGETIAHEVRQSTSFWLTSAEVSALHARYADLTVLGVSRPLEESQRRLFAGLLVGSGRPLLMVPEMAVAGDNLDRVVIAWKSSREASRALHDALPLLQRARSVEVLLVDNDVDRGSQGDDMGAHFTSHLVRHGVSAELVRRSSAHSTTGEAILDHAREHRADLIVAGGYSHPRALEQVFGGVTRNLLESATVPVLFSH